MKTVREKQRDNNKQGKVNEMRLEEKKKMMMRREQN